MARLKSNPFLSQGEQASSTVGGGAVDSDRAVTEEWRGTSFSVKFFSLDQTYVDAFGYQSDTQAPHFREKARSGFVCPT